MSNHRFAPRLSYDTEERAEMQISEEDRRNLPYSRASIEITDQLTGKRWKIRGASCGLRCFCDAVIVKEITCS